MALSQGGGRAGSEVDVYARSRSDSARDPIIGHALDKYSFAFTIREALSSPLILKPQSCASYHHELAPRGNDLSQ